MQDDFLIPVQILGFRNYGTGSVAVYLKSEEPKVVPIVVGHFEAQALLMATQKHKFPNPVAYDLIQAVLERVQGTVRQLVIHSIRENTFYAYLIVDARDESFLLDCRPSDGMVMATRLGAPIFLTAEVVEQAGAEPESS